MTTTLTIVFVAYLVGAIPFALIVARLYGIKDIRKVGSGNVGATNVQRAAGFKAAVWVYVFDISKGVVPVLIAKAVEQDVMSRDLFLVVVALAAILGHVFPIYLKFKGGKGVNTALGTMLVLMPIEAACAFGVFLIVVFVSRYISLGSICGALTLPLALLVETFAFDSPTAMVYWILAVFMALVIPLAHHQNIRRLIAGSENRFSFRATADDGGAHV